MKIQIHADQNIDANERLAAHITGVVEDELSRFALESTLGRLENG